MKKKNAPSPEASTDQGPAPRERTKKLAERLLATAALGSTTLGLSACPPMVCDPLPPPLECGNDPTTSYLQQWVGWQGVWRSDATGPLVEVTFTFYGNGSQDSITFGQDPILTGATLIDTTAPDTNVFVANLRPEVGATQIDLEQPITCGTVPEHLLLTVDLSAAPREGQGVPISSAE